eukprot:TRINITY_DN2933_c5_g3_i6.p2 TRINITY_DN2933_c5_g3~~TRINITY_DN2933_c5_g3_i6.p2  ORF type:complete len:244 (+),score=79.25 TRINITY_DN2933_c5_g3_i6:2348-3079(+)
MSNIVNIIALSTEDTLRNEINHLKQQINGENTLKDIIHLLKAQIIKLTEQNKDLVLKNANNDSKDHFCENCINHETELIKLQNILSEQMTIVEKTKLENISLKEEMKNLQIQRERMEIDFQVQIKRLRVELNNKQTSEMVNNDQTMKNFELKKIKNDLENFKEEYCLIQKERDDLNVELSNMKEDLNIALKDQDSLLLRLLRDEQDIANLHRMLKYKDRQISDLNAALDVALQKLHDYVLKKE